MFGDLGDTKHLTPVIKGAKYRQTYHAAVVGILGDKAPRVSSKGSLFYNKDRWTLRQFVKFMCEWAKANPGCVPQYKDVEGWVNSANAEKVLPQEREIVVANTPEFMPLRTALALTGGAYHEAAHSWTSCKRNLRTDEMFEMVAPRWAKVADWSRYAGALLEWSNIIEDVRIERCLRAEYEGTYIKLCDLQDFILNMEEEGQQGMRTHGVKPGPLSVISCTFRDVGLGYPTTTQKIALDRYRKDHPAAVELVLKGPLTPFLKETVELTKAHDTECLRLAMDVIATLGQLAKQDEESDQAKDGKPGDGKQKCPKCGASAGKLKVRPKSDGKGGKVKGKGIVTCTVCGFQAEVDIVPKKPQISQSLDPGDDETPEFEGFDASDFDFDGQSGQGSGKGQKGQKGSGGGKGKGEKGDEEGDDQNGSGGGKDGDKKDGDKKDGKGGGGKDGDKDDDGEGEGADGDDSQDADGDCDGDDDGEGEAGDADGDGSDAGGSDGPLGNTGDGDSSGSPAPGAPKGTGAGGYSHSLGPVSGKDLEDAAVAALAQAEKDGTTGIKDVAAALQAAINAISDRDDKAQKGEKAWRPFDPTMDEAILVEPSRQGRDKDQERARKLCESVKAQCTFLRARLRSVVRSLEQTGVARGLPKGRTLSDRYLVDTKVTLLAGEKPRRPFDEKGDRFDTSMAAAVVMDESGSMDGEYLVTATKVFIAITEPIDGLGFPTLALGFRDGGRSSGRWGGHYGYGGYHPYGNRVAPNGATDNGDYHRTSGITWDIFKGWNERFSQVMWRFANTRGEGGTPMGDGIQYALMALSQRNEAHRFLFVVTDGCPNGDHVPLIKRQKRLAKEAGIHIIGVGMGGGATSVKTLFDDYVWSNDLSEMPKLLVAKINELVDIRAAKRGTRVKKD